jgi:hypothetical protein
MGLTKKESVSSTEGSVRLKAEQYVGLKARGRSEADTKLLCVRLKERIFSET